MKNLTTAIYGKLAGSALAAHVGTRLYKGRAPEEATYPYIVFKVVTNSPNKTFSSDYEDTLIQFSLFSLTSSSTEIENMYADLITLFDECEMTIALGVNTLIWMRRINATQMVEDHTTTSGTIQVWAYHVDYMVTVKV